MRFRILDLFSITALLAIYLSSFLYALQYTKPGELLENSGLIIAVFAAHLVVYELVYQLMRRAAYPFLFVIESVIPWTPIIVGGIILWILALTSAWLSEGIFFVLSIPFLTFVLLSIIHRSMGFTKDGIFYLGWSVPWKIVIRIPMDKDKFCLRIGPVWLGLAVDISCEHREQVMLLMTKVD